MKPDATLTVLAFLAGLAGLAGLAAGDSALAQTTVVAPGSAARATAVEGATRLPSGALAPSPSISARYIESCQQGVERGVVAPGCQGPLYRSEIERLQKDALRTNDASLLTLLGDAFQSNRSAVSDIGQAYRWYLLAAVRGDPRAIERLSALYKDGRGAPQDNIKALGYARLAERLAVPGSAGAKRASATINALGKDMAAEEVALADRFATDLERNLQLKGVPLPSQSALSTAGATAGVPSAALSPSQPAQAVQPRSPPSAQLPGIGALPSPQADQSAPAATASPGNRIPGRTDFSPPLD